jgi:hypothetical protein
MMGLIFKISNAQNLNIGGIFPTLDHSGKLNTRFEYSLYYFSALTVINFKKDKIESNPYYHLLYAEQALHYNLSEKFIVTSSYVYQRENVFLNNYSNENRFYIQLKYKHTFTKFNITHRMRFDGRFIQNNITNKKPFTHRLRYLIGIDFPINEKTYFTAYEEPFFNTVKNSTPVYNENWAYGAFGKKLNIKNKVEAGLLYVTWNIGNSEWFNQYYLQLTWINLIDFKKKKRINEEIYS